MRAVSLLLLFALCWGCKRNELCYDHPHGNVRVEVVWDEIPEELQQRLPESVSLGFYPDAASGSKQVYTYYRGTYGGSVTIPDNLYDIMVYNADTEMILFRGMDKLETAEAYLAERTRQPYSSRADVSNRRIDYVAGTNANPLTRSLPLIREPDRFFASWLGREQITVGQTQGEQTIVAHPRSRVLLVTLTVAVKGLDGARSCRGSLSGAARSVWLGSYDRGEDTGTTIFDLEKKDEAHLTQTICVFGLNESPPQTPPEEQIQHILQLEFVMKDNKVVTFEFEVGDQIDFGHMEPEIEIPVLVEGEGVELPEVTGPDSGFDAEISGWGDEIDIIL